MDTQIKCWTRYYRSQFGVGILALIAFPVGIPIFIAGALLRSNVRSVVRRKQQQAWLQALIDFAVHRGVDLHLDPPRTEELPYVLADSMAVEQIAILHHALLFDPGEAEVAEDETAVQSHSKLPAAQRLALVSLPASVQARAQLRCQLVGELIEWARLSGACSISTLTWADSNVKYLHADKAAWMRRAAIIVLGDRWSAVQETRRAMRESTAKRSRAPLSAVLQHDALERGGAPEQPQAALAPKGGAHSTGLEPASSVESKPLDGDRYGRGTQPAALLGDHSLLEAEEALFLERVGFLVDHFRVECWFWQLVELLRKLLLTGLLSLMEPGSALQARLARSFKPAPQLCMRGQLGRASGGGVARWTCRRPAADALARRRAQVALGCFCSFLLVLGYSTMRPYAKPANNVCGAPGASVPGARGHLLQCY